jgi:Dolichyl-phosphate-mannose-protein mannosyltransferase
MEIHQGQSSTNGQRIKVVFYLLWLAVGLLHAGSAGLFDDEAYYWMYAQYPSMGYFDHPPMIGLLIKCGYALFANELGLRFFIVLMSTGTVWGIDALLSQRNDRLFYAMALSMGLMQVGGIIAVPDIPLMFFVVLFFLAYRRFLDKQGWSSTIALALTIAGMLYSKYHGILIVFFTLISNISLLKKWQTWMTALIALGLFSPHLYWQYTHDFPSFRYHLFERNASYYKFEYTTEYIFGQILLAGPLIGWLLLWTACNRKTVDHLEKALRWGLFGIYGFFLINTLKGRVEANWTAPAFIALFVLSHQQLNERPKAAKWVYRLFIPSFLLIMLVRVYMMLDINPSPLMPKDEFHKNAEWAKVIRKKADGRAIVFVNTYQRPSQYMFYTKEKAYGLNNIFYRRNNFNFWPVEADVFGKPALVISHENYTYFTDTIHSPRGYIGSRHFEAFFSFSGVDIRSPGTINTHGKKLNTTLELRIPDHLATHPLLHSFDSAQIVMAIYVRDKKKATLLQTGSRLRDAKNGKLDIELQLPDDFLQEKNYQIKWGINSAIPGWPSLNSSDFKLVLAP